jgi:hypothetical protein
MKTIGQTLAKWKNITIMSLISLSLISITSILVNAATFSKVKYLEQELLIIKELIKNKK